jgi:putative ABC transport system permease protein
MLLGEQALLTAAAIPFGLLLGYGICAAVVAALNALETFRLPLVLTARTYLFAVAVVAAAAVVSGLAVYRRICRLDLVAVLKTRE